MWGSGAGWWCGALAAAALLAVLAACRSRAKRTPHDPVVHIVRGPAGRRAARASRPPAPRALPRALPPLAPRRILAALSGKPADEPPTPPQILIIQNSTQNTIDPQNQNPSSSQIPPTEYKGIPKLPLPEQWIHKRPLDYKYTTIPRPLAQLSADLGADLSQESRAKKYSATRSPSLEKDDKSPFLGTKSDVFGFDSDLVQKLSDNKEATMMSPKESDERSQDASPSNLRRFRSVSTRLNMCSVNEAHLDNQQERLEMQNSPRVVECSSAKEKSNASKFDFSPKLLDTMCSPRFFTPPEMVSPMFFNEPSPKSVYYDTVRSPKFFPETPRDAEVPQSPRTLGDHLNRNGIEKPSSPRVLSARPSPKVHSYNKENYFTFEQAHACLEEIPRVSPRPRKYGGRNSIEKERFTPPADKEVQKYRRHNSCDTNYKTVEVNITKCDDNKNIQDHDVVDCCARIDAIEIQPNMEDKAHELTPSAANSAQARRQRLKSISLDSDNAKIIEQNLGLPIAKQLKDQMNEAYKIESTSCDSIERYQKTPTNERPCFKFEDDKGKKSSEEEEEPKSPDLLQRKCLRQSSDTQSFIDMPRFSPKEFEITVTSEEGATCAAETQSKPKSKNLRNLTIDLTKRDSELEKELLEFDKLFEKKVKTPTLKIKATSLDSSETVNLSLPQQKTLEVPQNSVSVPNTPKRQLKRILAQKNVKHDFAGAKLGYNSIQTNAEQRRLYMKGQDSGIYLREHHANLMLYQPGTSRMGSRTMGSFDENMDFETTPEINISSADNRSYLDTGQTLGSNLLNYKQNLSVSSTNLKTLPEGVPSDDFEPSAEDEKVVKKLHRRNSNQSLLLSTHSLQSSNCSLNSSGASCHNIATVRTSISNFSLNDRKKLSLERRDSNASLKTEHLTPTTRVICSSNTSLSGDVSKNCLLQRRGSNNSLTLNIHSSSLSRHSSNSSLNKDAKTGPKKGLLERRSSNTSLTLNINNSNPQLSVNRGLSISNYNLNGSTCNLSRYNSNHSIDNANMTVSEPRKGILERRSSNTSLTLNIPQEPRDIEIDDRIEIIENNLTELPHRDKHRKSLSTENLIPKSYKRTRLRSTEKGLGFGSHDNLWSTSYTEQDCPQNLTYVCGDQENEIIYAFGRQDDPNFQAGFVRNITTKPLSPQSTSEDFRLYLANMQHLQNASSVLSRKQLRDLNNVFQNGYSKVKCHIPTEGQHCCTGRVEDMSKENPQMVIPEITPQPCSEYQKMLLRNLHQEFWDMPTNFQEKPIVSGSHTKNRYKTILPNEHSRCLLRTDAGNTEGYINANFIKGHEYTKNSYIATQGPLQNTIYDFWLMVHQNSTNLRSQRPLDHVEGLASPAGVQKVVMLTNFIENNRQKCEKYFPLELNEEIEVFSPEDDTNSFVVKNYGMIHKAGYTIRKLDVRYVKVYDVKNEASEQIDVKSDFSEQYDVVQRESSEQNEVVHIESMEQNDVPSESEQNADSDSPKMVFRSELKSDSEGEFNSDAKSDIDTKDDATSDSVTVYHYWFHNWADHKCPKDVDALLNLSLDVLKESLYDFDCATVVNQDICKCNDSPKPESKFLFPPLECPVPCEVKVNVSTPLDLTVETLSPPTIVHCSAGIGRTGCLIAILNGIKQLTNEHKVDVLGIVCNMRLNRGGMVQNSEQYELIHKVLCLYEQACLPKLL